jgi:hypothetical protein
MLQQSTTDYVASFQAVSAKYLKPIQCEQQCDAVIKWASLFFKEKECFSNSLNLSIVDGCDYVLGYVFLKDFNLAIEHAWNRDEQGHFDLTAQLFWKHDTQVEYFELLRLNASNAQLTFESFGGVDHMSLRRSSEYKYLFSR